MAEDDKGPSIWLFVAGFLVLGALGLAAVLIWGSPVEDTRVAKVPQTLGSGEPRPGGDGAASTSPEGPTEGDADGRAPTTVGGETDSDPSFEEDSATPVTFPDGRPAPAEVREVLRTDDTISLAFRVSKDAIGDHPQAVVPPIRAKPAADGNSLDLSIGCARSGREALAQVSAVMTNATITVSAVVLAPSNAAGCDPSASPRKVTVPLGTAIGNRSIAVVPAGTELPDVELG